MSEARKYEDLTAEDYEGVDCWGDPNDDYHTATCADEVVEDLIGHCEGEIGSTIQVAAFKIKPIDTSALADTLLDCAWEVLQEEHRFEDAPDAPPEALKTAAEVFAKAIAEAYPVDTVDEVFRVDVQVLAWLWENNPQWLDDATVEDGVVRWP